MPSWPVNHSAPARSKAAVLRLAKLWVAGSVKRFTARVSASTRTIALAPPSVTQAAPSAPTMTPCGAEPYGLDLAGGGIEPPESALRLRREPDAAIRRRRHVVRPSALGQLVIVHDDLAPHGGGEQDEGQHRGPD